MIVLSFECSSSNLSVALAQDQKILSSAASDNPKKHSELIHSLIADVLNKSGKTFQDIQMVATTLGPGSFTGVRVGINVAKTLGFTLGIPVYACTTAELIRFQNSSEKKSSAVWINAYKNMIYFQNFKADGTAATAVDSLAVADLERYLSELKISDSTALPISLYGNGFPAFQKFLSSSIMRELKFVSEGSHEPQADQLALMASADFKMNDKTKEWSQLVPLYVRESEAEEKQKGILLKPLPGPRN